MPKGSPPDFTLWAGGDNGSGRCGAAWKADDGSINIVLDPWAILRGKGHSGGAQTIKLYVRESGPKEERPKAAPGINPRAADKAGQREDLEDDIPF